MTRNSGDKRNQSDVIVGLTLLVFAIVAFFIALHMHVGSANRTFPPNTIPIICSLGIGSIGATLFVHGLLSGTCFLPMILSWRQLLTVALITLFILAFEKIDFRLNVSVFVFVTMFILGCRDWRQLLLIPVLTSIGIWTIFYHFFKILLPTWI